MNPKVNPSIIHILLVDDDAFFAYCPNITQPLAVAALKDPLSTRTLE